MVSTKQQAQTADDQEANRQHNNNQDIDETTNAGLEPNAAAADANTTNPTSGSATSSANDGTGNADSFVISSNVDARNLGPGAYHVVPLVGGAAAAATADADTDNANVDQVDDNEGDEATTNAVVNATYPDGSAHDIAVTATLVVEDDEGEDPNRNRNDGQSNHSSLQTQAQVEMRAHPVPSRRR